MKDIKQLIPDIQEQVTKKNGWFDEAISSELRHNLGLRLGDHFNSQRYVAGRTSLRLSQMGERCPCQLWYSIHHPELAEPLPPWAEVKFAFGHILEALVISLAKAAGHTVTGEQDELVLDGITGHRDCVIDGCTVDIKSASSIGFNKFKNPNFPSMDSFGYLDQIDGYVVAARNDPLVLVKDRGYILGIDKTLGHMVLYEHGVTAEREAGLKDRIERYKAIVKLDTPPSCTCKTKVEGASGNIRLDGAQATYSSYKHCCNPNVRTFLYAGKNGEKRPVFLTKVVRKPDVPEINKYGQYVYN